MTAVAQRTADPASDWSTCGGCRVLLYAPRFTRQLQVCADCGHHARLTAAERLDQLLDPASTRTIGPLREVRQDPLDFVDVRPYSERLTDARRETGMEEAVRCVEGTIEGHRVVVAAMDFRFLGGSLGAGVGELVASAAEHALATRTPLLIVPASGGARMQEGVLSLMQMAKTTSALSELDAAGVLTISLLTDPTYGGVAASYATATRIILAEPGARAGFAGPRVIEQTIGQVLPPGFQTAEFLLEHGLIDAVVPRAALRGTLTRLLATVAGTPGPVQVPDGPAPVTDPEALPEQDPWRTVQLVREPTRPTTLDYIAHLTDGFTELRGDRLGEDCPALVGGLARMGGTGVVVLGHQKGRTTRDLVARRFGMPSPAGYRKAARLMRLAATLRLPVVTFVDTPGAYPGTAAEEHGQAFAIADNLMLMASLRTPVVTVVTGEGGSGGALAVAVGDTVFALSNAVYSVISPEGCAAILWKSPGAAATAAAALRLGARDLLARGVVDAVLPEPGGGAQTDHVAAAAAVGSAVGVALRELVATDPEELVRRRRSRFRRFGLLEVR